MTLTRPHALQLAGLPSRQPSGLVLDGVADEAPAINAAIDAAFTAGGGEVYLPPGQYGISTAILLKEGVALRGAGIGSTELVLNATMTALIDADTGSLGDTIALTANAIPGATALQLSSTAGLVAGDYLLLKHQHQYSSQSTTYRAGELVRIESVDSATQVTLWSAVVGSMDAASGYAYTTAYTATVQKVTFIEGCQVSGMTLTMDTARTTMGIRMRYVRAGVVENVLIRNGGSDAVRMQLVADSRINGLIAQDLLDDIPGGHSGYGIHCTDAVDGLAISNCHFIRLRHGFTTGSVGSNGIPHRVVVSNCTGKYCTAAAFDTHEAGDGIMFSGCHSLGGSAHGISLRSVNTQVVGCLIQSVNTGHGINIPEDQSRNLTIRDTTIRDVLQAGQHGINVTTTTANLVIAGCRIENIAADGISVHSNSPDAVIVDNIIKGFGVVSPSRLGINATNSVGSTARWLVARNFIRVGSAGSADIGVSLTNLSSSWAVDNKAFGTFGTAAFSLGTNVDLRNDLLT